MTSRPASLFDSPLSVLLLAGGPGAEREVSLTSGQAVAQALTARGHDVTVRDIGPNDLSALEGSNHDAVFVALHGEFGEDGRLQRILEHRDLAYVGSGSEASALAFNKSDAKRLYRSAGVLTPTWSVLSDTYDPFHNDTLLERVPRPRVLKPLGGGSSVDVFICPDDDACAEAREKLLGSYGQCLVEAFVPGRELTVSVLGDQPLPILEIRPGGAFYDYRAKYLTDDTEYLFETDLSETDVLRIQTAALRAHQALGCRDMSRTDFLLDPTGSAWALETNTIPGFTSHSLLPKAAARAGVEFGELCERLLTLALARRSD
jgi:D-alanine-D-alanine ligase